MGSSPSCCSVVGAALTAEEVEEVEVVERRRSSVDGDGHDGDGDNVRGNLLAFAAAISALRPFKAA